MHLKQLKLAGFKSFVDPTVVHFPSQLVAVVGPNGCGKSNIIDAIRWVIGESSAKNLRGESMRDVIFNGSSNRKSVGQASVELVFDNSLGRLTGPYASYGEIAVKRVVTRDGDSSYFLNKTRCRRKDITDIFLGTGAGARGYSIIGQGTISQLIEAKPEDLRGFLEEAAGVSKYKERRRETIQRIDHTRDNLTRVTDIRQELENQLQRLERQAKAAKHYLILKEKEHVCRAEILALKWREFMTQYEIKQGQLRDLVVSYEQQQSALTKTNTKRVELNEKLHDITVHTEQTQASFYQLGTEIVRLEEGIQQQNREKKRLEHDRQHMLTDCHIAEEQLKRDKDELLNSQQNAQNAAKKLEQFRNQYRAHEADWQNIQNKQMQWEQQWQEVQAQANNLKHALQIEQVNARHLAEQYQQTLLRLEKLKVGQESISIDDLLRVKQELQEKQIQLIANQQLDELQLKQNQENREQLRSQLHGIERQLHRLQDEFHRLNSEYAALMAIQHAARQSMQTFDGVAVWSDKPRLMDMLHVETKWQFACERVLNDALHAYVVETFDTIWSQRSVCEDHGAHIVTFKKFTPNSSTRSRLIDKIRGDIPNTVLPLEHVYTAENVDEALHWLPELADHQSIITLDGFWLGKGWAKFVCPNEQDELGFLSRQQKIADLSGVVEELKQKIDALREERDHAYQQVQKSIKENELQQLKTHENNETLRINNVVLSAKEQAIIQAEKQRDIIIFESNELQLFIEDIVTKQCHSQEKLLSLEDQSRRDAQLYEQGLHKKQKWQETLVVQEKQRAEGRAQLHQAELEYDREKNKIQQFEERIQREQERVNNLHERLTQLTEPWLHSEQPGERLKEQLKIQLKKYSEVELQLALSREQLAQFRMELEVCSKNIQNNDFEVKHLQELMNQTRIDEEALKVRASSIQESLNELDLPAKVVLENMPDDTTQSMCEDKLMILSEKIKRLGAINLAAIEEYNSEQQRKMYLDEQHDDLCHALATLETAIEKMDKETCLRLETTFDEINTSFKALFPRLFGGGKAQLELTCDNLLETGIVVMAQPPGKRNSTIHLLSGGEKAMTAVALVFAIFQLNPSPFCMLDEVDAPLDDVNVGRFCALVKEMSEFVQFLFITHNKVTMELAEHLIGVTMREPGVSRLVAVDVTRALAME